MALLSETVETHWLYLLMTYFFFYLLVIRPVIEYGCAFWHSTVAQSRKLESLQKRALRIIHPVVYGMLYDSA